jgi:hypothetical protein
LKAEEEDYEDLIDVNNDKESKEAEALYKVETSL